MGLKDYADKRDFSRTPEPRPDAPSGLDPQLFVVQRHDASSLHYDLRLRVGDTLVSWAVPKGPSLDPREKRLAVRVEDHPVAYADFEGTIPRGEYGAGTVMLWDMGRWSAENDPAASLAEGMLKFRLDGRRLNGRWMLVRTTRDPAHWLLVKERDADAAPGVHAETFATSVRTGRTMDQITRGEPSRQREELAQPPRASALKGARAAPMPDRVKPQLAAASDRAPDGPDWFHEVKFDGYRLMIHAGRESTRIVSRGGLDWTDKLGAIVKAVADRLRVEAVLDGEAVMLDARGVSEFQALQNAIHGRRAASIVFFASTSPGATASTSPAARSRTADVSSPPSSARPSTDASASASTSRGTGHARSKGRPPAGSKASSANAAARPTREHAPPPGSRSRPSTSRSSSSAASPRPRVPASTWAPSFSESTTPRARFALLERSGLGSAPRLSPA